MQKEGDISNHTLNFYYGGIEFDTDGAARITCGQIPKAIITVDCWPPQVAINNGI